MTTLHMQAPSNLEASATEDPMELTSEMDRRFTTDDDIDIDLDLTVDNYQYEEDEHMGEDVNVFTDMASMNEQDMQAGNDDEMTDDNYVEGSIARQSSVRDEDLEDAGDAELYPADEDTIVEPQLGQPSEIPQGLLEAQDQISKNSGQDSDYLEQASPQEFLGAAPESPSVAQKEYDSSHDASAIAAQESSQGLASQYYETSRHENQDHQYNVQEPHREYEDHTRRHEGDSHWNTSKESRQGSQVDTSKQEASNYEYSTDVFNDSLLPGPETAIEQPEQQEAVGAPPKDEPPHLEKAEDRTKEYRNGQDEATSRESAHVHPVVVLYQDNEISLFPPLDSDDEHTNTYFLQNEQIAGDSIKALFGALRSILGESISEQEELVLDINDLDLHISESTAESSTTTLMQVIDVYNHLQHYDGIENVPPLYMHLTTKASFSHRFEFLLNAIVEGKGLSQLRSSEVGEEIEQPEVDDVQGHEPGDALHQDDVTGDTEAEVAEHKEIPESESIHDKVELPSELPPLMEPSRDSTTATQDFAPSSSFFDTPASETDDADDYSEIKETQGDQDPKEIYKIEESQEEKNHEEEEEEDVNEAIETNDAAAIAPASTLSRERLAEKPVEATLDEEDTIEYEDEEEPAHGTSTGSSTLQGDVVDANPHYDQAETGDPTTSMPAQEFNNSPNFLDPTTEPENHGNLAEEKESTALENDGDFVGGNSDLSQPSGGPVRSTQAQTKQESPIQAKDEEAHIDEDEITYEDEDDIETPEEPVNLEQVVASSPRSLKRARSFDGDDGDLEDESQDVKRVRSG